MSIVKAIDKGETRWRGKAQIKKKGGGKGLRPNQRVNQPLK